MLSHEEQVRRLKQSCPPAVPAAVVAGDICLDRMAAGLPWRPRYRDELGVRPGRRLVVVTSTWGPRSLLGRHPDLPARLLAELPADEFGVAAIVHPNVWYGEGPWQLRAWLADARRAGLVLIPPHEGWRAAVVAADCLVGDHGSVTLYGAVLGRPVILAGYGADDIDPGTAMAAMGGLAPHLDHGRPLRAQLERAIAAHHPGRSAELADLAVAAQTRGRAARILRALIYEHLGIPEPAGDARTLPVPPPVPEPPSWEHGGVPATYAEVVDDRSVVRLERYPAVLGGLSGRPPRDACLVIDDTETDERLRQLAAVIVRRAGVPGPMAERTPGQVFAANPACELLADAASERRLAVWCRDGRSYAIAYRDLDPAAVAAAAYARTSRDRDPPTELTLALGPRSATLTITPDSPA